MANTEVNAQASKQPVEATANTLSEKMDRAVAEDNRGAYDNSMREINDAREKMQPTQQHQFDKQLNGSIEFQTAALYDMKRNYSNIDADGNSRLSKEELETYAGDKNTSPLQRAFINNHVIPNYDNISNISSDRFGSWTGWRDSEIRIKDLDTGLKNGDRMKHFYEKGADGKSLYDRFKDEDGNLNGIKDALGNPQQYGLNDKDVDTLKYIQEKRSNWTKLPFRDDMKADDLKQISEPLGAQPGPEAVQPANETMKHFYEKGASGKSLFERFKDDDGNLNGINEAIAKPQQYGLSEKDVESLKFIQEQRSGFSKLPFTNDMTAAELSKLPGTDGFTDEQRDKVAKQQGAEKVAEKPVVKPGEKPAEVAATKEPLPSDKLMEAAKVRRGEGPFHSAERMLAADGKQHSFEEVRALSKALQELYKAENHGSMKDLRVNHQFVTKENFKKLINMVNNEAAREALKKLAAA